MFRPCLAVPKVVMIDARFGIRKVTLIGRRFGINVSESREAWSVIAGVREESDGHADSSCTCRYTAELVGAALC